MSVISVHEVFDSRVAHQASNACNLLTNKVLVCISKVHPEKIIKHDPCMSHCGIKVSS